LILPLLSAIDWFLALCGWWAMRPLLLKSYLGVKLLYKFWFPIVFVAIFHLLGEDTVASAAVEDSFLHRLQF